MRKFWIIFKGIWRGFLFNPFWKSWQVVLIIILTLVINGILWYIYQLSSMQIKENPLPFIFSTGIIGLNLVLGNFLWNRERLASLFLIIAALLAQILMLLFIRYLTLVF